MHYFFNHNQVNLINEITVKKWDSINNLRYSSTRSRYVGLTSSQLFELADTYLNEIISRTVKKLEA